MEYLRDRLQEPSTWRGLIWVLSAFGVAVLTPEQAQAVTALGMALAGVGGFLPGK